MGAHLIQPRDVEIVIKCGPHFTPEFPNRLRR